MSKSFHIACPHCESVNRIPAARLEEGPKCSDCRQPLCDTHPAILTATNFQKHISRN